MSALKRSFHRESVCRLGFGPNHHCGCLVLSIEVVDIKPLIEILTIVCVDEDAVILTFRHVQVIFLSPRRLAAATANFQR